MVRSAKRPRILYLWDGEYPWDVRTEKICRTLGLNGLPTGLIARNRQRQALVEEMPEGRVHRLPPLPLLPRALDDLTSLPFPMNLRWTRHISRTIAAFRPDVLIVRDIPLCPAALRAARRHRLPLILDMAENYPGMIADVWKAGRQRRFDFVVRNPRAVAAVERYCVRRVDMTLVVVEESRDRIVALGANPEKVAVVSNTPPRSRALATLVNREDEDRLDVVYLGMMELTRGVGELIEAAAQLRRSIRGLRVRLIGDGRDRAILEDRAAALGLTSGTVEFLGFMPNREALELVSTAHVGVVPHHRDESWDTTIPNKLFDYMAAGLAVVTSDAVPAARVVRDSRAGAVFRSNDSSDCARAIETFSDSERRSQAGDAGRQAVLNHYNWENDTERLLAAVDTVLVGS